MKGRLIAVVAAVFVSASAGSAGEFTPDWMPPAPPVTLLWDTFEERPAALPGTEFSDILLQLSANSSPGSRLDPDRFKMNNVLTTDFGKVTSNLDLSDPRDPRLIPVRDWKATHSVNLPLPVSDSIFMFSDVNSSSASLDNQMINMTGRTGVAMKWTPFGNNELQFRTGTLMSYTDNFSTNTRSTERSQFCLGLQAKLALFGPLQLKYVGEALPAITQSDRTTLSTDVKLAMPLGNNQEFYVGAKYKWEDTLTPTPWMDRAQLYLGLTFQR